MIVQFTHSLVFKENYKNVEFDLISYNLSNYNKNAVMKHICKKLTVSLYSEEFEIPVYNNFRIRDFKKFMEDKTTPYKTIRYWINEYMKGLLK